MCNGNRRRHTKEKTEQRHRQKGKTIKMGPLYLLAYTAVFQNLQQCVPGLTSIHKSRPYMIL